MEFIDLKTQYKKLQVEIDRNIKKVIENGQFVMGTEVEELEVALQAFVGRKYCVTCGSGTDALQMAYMALGVGQGDAVFCPDVTFIASVEPACMLGATPVFCDIDIGTYNLSPSSLEKQIVRTIHDGILAPKVVVAVDFLGNPADYKEIEVICEKYHLELIEDAAQGIGASYQGKRCGSFGRVAITSFFPSKPLGGYGDGGALFTDDPEIADLCRSIRVHGKGKNKYDNIRIGMNSRLDALQAAILLPKLEALNGYEIESREEIARKYDMALREKFQIEVVRPGNVSIFAQYAVLTRNEGERNHIRENLMKVGIPSMIYYPTPLHRLKVFAYLNLGDDEYTSALRYCETTLSLPMHPYLTSRDQELVISAVCKQ